MAKNTVDGGNPSEPIHGFDGATPGEVIQSVVQVKAGTDFPFDPFIAHDLSTFGYASGTTAGTVDVPSTARLRAVQVLAGSTLVGVTIGGGPVIGVPPGSAWETDLKGLAVGMDVVFVGGVVSYYVSWVD